MSDGRGDIVPAGPEGDGRPAILDHGEGRAEWVLSRIDELITTIDECYVESCSLLAEARDNQYYRVRGYSTLREYARAKYGTKQRKMYYLIGIEDKLIREVGIPRERVATVGWSAAKEIASLPADMLRDGKAEEWLQQAEQLTVEQLADKVRRARKQYLNGAAVAVQNEDAEVFSPFRVMLAPVQRQNVELAMDIAHRMDGTEKRCQQLNIICADFIAGRHKEIGAKLQTVLHALESAFEVEILAMKIKGSERECVYSSRGLKKYLQQEER